ncbi:1,2-phenylacetyl-CoA epoxidase subunit PaaD [Polymorphospora rubra]|uniref:1,2-phenylacetyl-CoA epoxidase subunit PaaD n=1 Tax=Polymorphospora rubra TaxID=338584 RepID=UPI001BB3657D|nr:1,2-phenylacetyl-CoA epoxidase subunit PaaD [Polymorphospora rubra]
MTDRTTTGPAAAGAGPAVRAAVAAVVDPEIRVVTIADLGILRDVTTDPATGRVTVTITPTYTGCPAMDVIRADIRRALTAAGHPEAEVRTVFAPPWSTDWITAEGRAKLAAAGIAPPGPVRTAGPVAVPLAVRCPRCGAPDTEQISRFGSTACKALWRCRSCREPFDHVKAL